MLFKSIPYIVMFLKVLCKKLMRKKASLQDLYRLYQVVIRIPKIIAILTDLLNSTVENVIVSPLKDTLEVRRVIIILTYVHDN